MVVFSFLLIFSDVCRHQPPTTHQTTERKIASWILPFFKRKEQRKNQTDSRNAFLDHEINVSELIKLWVAEGFLKLSRAKNLEEVAMDCLKELTDRNLILVHKRGSCLNIKTCKIHDLLRELCLKEAHKEKFRCVTQKLNFYVPPPYFSEDDKTRTIFLLEKLNAFVDTNPCEVLDEYNQYVLELVNFRYLDFMRGYMPYYFPFSVCIIWNLQTLIVRNTKGNNTSETVAPSIIWEMPQLRHIKFYSVSLPDPQKGCGCVMKNLQTLVTIEAFRCCEEVLMKIPNIKKLQIRYKGISWEYWNVKKYCLDNLGRLLTLESLSCSFDRTVERSHHLLANISFPKPLKKLTLLGSNLSWYDMGIIASLPNLEILKLRVGSFKGNWWYLSDGESLFVSLKYLLIEGCCDLRQWRANATHFPRLVSLVLKVMPNLEEIPFDLGEIPTLRSIKLHICRDSAVISAKNIMEYQESFGIEDLRVEVLLRYGTTLDLSITSKNFLVQLSFRKWVSGMLLSSNGKCVK